MTRQAGSNSAQEEMIGSNLIDLAHTADKLGTRKTPGLRWIDRSALNATE